MGQISQTFIVQLNVLKEEIHGLWLGAHKMVMEYLMLVIDVLIPRTQDLLKKLIVYGDR